MPRELEYPSYPGTSSIVPNISWGAVFAGTFVAIAVMGALSLLGAGIGLVSAPSAGSAQGLAKSLGIGAAAWLFVSGVLSFYAGGWMTGRLTRAGLVSESVVHSVVTWAFATCAFMFVLTSVVGGVFGGAAHLLGSGAQAAAIGGAGVASNPSQSPQLGQRVQGGANRITQQAQANATTREDVRRSAESASTIAGATGIGGFVLMLAELLACAAGGRAGTRLLRPRPIGSTRAREMTSVG